MEEEGCYPGISESRHDYSIAVPLFHCTLQLKVLGRVSISNLGLEMIDTYLRANQKQQQHFPLIPPPQSCRISIALQFSVSPDGDAPDAVQAEQSLHMACSNDQRVLKAASYVRLDDVFRA